MAVNGDMDFSDLPRRQRTARSPAPAQYEDGYTPYGDSTGPFRSGNGYRRFVRPAGGPPQRAPWDDGPSPAGAGDATDAGAVPGDFAPARPGGRHARRPRGRGLPAGAVTGFLAAAVALGVANLAAAFVRPQASPVIAVGGAFIDRTPPALKNFAVQKFGENDKNMLLLGMYVTIALIAIVVGMLAWRHLTVGVAGIGLFGLFGAFVAITRPASQLTDVIPAIAGGIAGVAAMLWLVRTGTRRAGPRSATRDTGWTA